MYGLAADPVTLSVVITDADTAEPHTTRTLYVSQGGKVYPVNRGKPPTNTNYAVEVTVEGEARNTFEWTDPDLALAPLYVIIENPQNIEFLIHAG